MQKSNYRQVSLWVFIAVVGLTLLPLDIAAFNPVTPATRAPGNTSGSFQGIPTRTPIANGSPAGGSVAHLRELQYAPDLCVPSSGDQSNPNSKIYTKSYYVKDNFNGIYQLGVGLAQQYGNAGRDCTVILDFGQAAAMTINGATVEGVNGFSGPFIGTGEVAILAEQFISGYFATAPTPTSHITIILGVNLYCKDLVNCKCPDPSNPNTCNLQTYIVDSYSNHASAWAQVVKTVDMYFAANFNAPSAMEIAGGADFETSYNFATDSKLWASVFQSAGSYFIYDFGDAGGCPPSDPTATDPNKDYPCLNGWKQSDVWNVAWGFLFSKAIPEIYFDVLPVTMSQQWALVSRVGQYQHGGQAIVFSGVLTQYDGCLSSNFQNSGCKDGSTNTLTPYVALTKLQQAVAQTIPWSTDIRYAP